MLKTCVKSGIGSTKEYNLYKWSDSSDYGWEIQDSYGSVIAYSTQTPQTIIHIKTCPQDITASQLYDYCLALMELYYYDRKF